MILIIDDDIAVRASLVLLLRSEGYKVNCIFEAEALSALKHQEVTLDNSRFKFFH